MIFVTHTPLTYPEYSPLPQTQPPQQQPFPIHTHRPRPESAISAHLYCTVPSGGLSPPMVSSQRTYAHPRQYRAQPIVAFFHPLVSQKISLNLFLRPSVFDIPLLIKYLFVPIRNKRQSETFICSVCLPRK